ncbi:MAG: hydrogenase nickel incorporation protein HypB [Leptolyngbyaceae cyanobacterium MO_188.B28]|nr:hydrogenase nickel incorporation protein HypB [Leptolyngbyaceae cyanobacterium MO_188.B28]
MCTTCGCAQVDSAAAYVAPLTHETHAHEPHTHKSHTSNLTHTLAVHTRLLAKNDQFAQQNRDRFQACGLLALNFLSSPGSGKTALIEQTAKVWGGGAERVGVIVGDLATENDAQRLRSVGAIALQITTGSACHLEADMVAHALSHLDLDSLDLMVIENVGNLVCPAAYDLGEARRAVLLSVTEGEDKPLKYPTAFQSADVVILTKMDIAQAVGFDRTSAIDNIRHMAPRATVFELSVRTGEGIDTWVQYLQAQRQSINARNSGHRIQSF